MSYKHVNNLYKDQTILMFKECFAMEKVHGSSSHLTFRNEIVEEPELIYFSGGEKHETFKQLFNGGFLLAKFKEVIKNKINVTIYGEVYGGKCQGMRDTYGNELRFVAFEVKIGDRWLNVLEAEEFVKQFSLEFVAYNKISTELEFIDRERDLDSTQAIRNGMGKGKKREGIVLRPLEEFVDKYGQRVVAKHKRDVFKETKTKREVLDPNKLKVLEQSNAIAEEWVTEMRLSHVLDKIENPCMQKMGEIIGAMAEDVKREAKGEIVWSKETQKAINKRTAFLTKQ
ncbi:hypothetical protein LCGC14_2115790, partial [marine sediment metagenome]